MHDVTRASPRAVLAIHTKTYELPLWYWKRYGRPIAKKILRSFID